MVSVEESEGAGLSSKFVCELCAEVDLHALYGIEHDESELPVEDIKVPDLVE